MSALPDLSGAAPALFLDIDGTLLVHQAPAEAVSVDEALRRLLIAAAERLDGALAFVTGRSIEMVDRLFLPLSLPVAGLYGLEHRLKAGGDVALAEEPADVRAVREALQGEFHSTQGIYFERKGPVLAIHTRDAPDSLAAVQAAAERVLPDLPEGYRVVTGHAGLEFMPVDALKSAAILRFMELDPFRDRVPVFIGDDVSDECGFDCVNEIGGVSIKVGSGKTAARYRLPDVAAVRSLIRDELLAGRPRSGARPSSAA